MGVFFSTAETSAWRCSEISCSKKPTKAPRKHPWTGVFYLSWKLKVRKLCQSWPLYGYFSWKFTKIYTKSNHFAKKRIGARLQNLSTHSTLKNACYILLVQSKWLRRSKYFNYNLSLREILKIIKRCLVNTTFKRIGF